MYEFLGKRGVPLVAVTTPYAIQVYRRREVREALQAKPGVPDLFYSDRRIEAYARKQAIAVVPSSTKCSGSPSAGETCFHGSPNTRLGMGHWNENGHRAAAEIIARRLCALGL